MITALVAWRSISAPKTKEFIQPLFKPLKPKRGLSISDVGRCPCISMEIIVGASRLNLCANMCEYGCFMGRERELYAMISGIKQTVFATRMKEAWQAVMPPAVHRKMSGAGGQFL